MMRRYNTTMAPSPTTAATGDSSHPKKSRFENLPNETLLEITRYLSPVQKVCVALTCHQLHDLILPASSTSRLTDIVPRYPKLTMHQVLMARLVSWMQPEYTLCQCKGDKFVRKKPDGSLNSCTSRQMHCSNKSCFCTPCNSSEKRVQVKAT